VAAEKASPRDELERELWALTEWRGGAELMDKLLAAADRYAEKRVAEAGSQQPVDLNLAAPAQQHPALAQGGSVGSGNPVSELAVGSESSLPEPATGSSGSPGTGKACRECGEWKHWDGFHVDKSRTDGRRSRCRECCNKALREKKRNAAAV